MKIEFEYRVNALEPIRTLQTTVTVFEEFINYARQIIYPVLLLVVGMHLCVNGLTSFHSIYFRWLENNVIAIEKAASIPLIFNHLK